MTEKFKGIIVYIKKVKDHDLYIKILSSRNEINSGLVYGGNSSKKKIIYQNGYFIDYSITKKNLNSPSIFIGELSKPFLGNIFNDKYKLNALLSISSLINISIIEGQKISGLYYSVENLINNINNKKRWIIFYCEWLLYLMQIIGYQIDYIKNADIQYYDIMEQNFSYKSNNNTIKFPHNLFSNKGELSYINIQSVFLIFEKIYSKNHLDNINYNMPVQFLNFKELILNKLKFI